MGDAPQQPRRVAAEAHEAEIGHRRGAANGGEVAEVAVAEGLVEAPARQAGANESGDVLALLLGHRRDAGKWAPRTPLDARGVADDEDVRQSHDREVGAHLDPALVVALGPEPAARRRGHDAGRPDHGAGVDASARDECPGGVHVLDPGVGVHLDAEPFQRSASDLRQALGIDLQYARRRLQQNDAGGAWIDIAKIPRHDALRELGDGAGEFDPRGPAADHDEGKQAALLLAVLAGRGPLERQQYLGADGGGVFDLL